MRAMILALSALSLAAPLAAQAKKEPAKAAKAAEPAKPEKVEWDGEWSLVPDKSDKLEGAIEAHVADQNFAMKIYWKKKLQNACAVWPALDILAGDGFSVTLGKESPVSTTGDGAATDWKRKDGEKFQVSLRAEGARMIQTFQGDGYTLTFVYSMRPDGETLALQVTYAHPKLANNFSYKLVYQRNA